MGVFSHVANNYVVSMSRGTVLCCPLGFRHRHRESFLVKHFGGLVLFVHLSIFLFRLFVSHQLCDFWSNFNWLEVLSFSQQNCMRGDNRHDFFALQSSTELLGGVHGIRRHGQARLCYWLQLLPHRFCHALKISVNRVNFWDADKLHFDGYHLLISCF